MGPLCGGLKGHPKRITIFLRCFVFVIDFFFFFGGGGGGGAGAGIQKGLPLSTSSTSSSSSWGSPGGGGTKETHPHKSSWKRVSYTVPFGELVVLGRN